MSHTIYISNKSKILTLNDFNCILTACNALLPTVCKHWNIPCPIISQSTQPQNLLKTTFVIVDNISANCDIENTIPIKPILDNGGVILYKDDVTPTVASAIFRELCNYVVDKDANGWWVDLRSDVNNPTFYANEICDQVQNTLVKITVGNSGKNGVVVGLSDFIFPAWKESNVENKQLNYTGNLTTPFSHNKNGSLIKFTPNQGVIQVFGEDVPNWTKNLKNESHRYNVRKLFNKV